MVLKVWFVGSRGRGPQDPLRGSKIIFLILQRLLHCTGICTDDSKAMVVVDQADSITVTQI